VEVDKVAVLRLQLLELMVLAVAVAEQHVATHSQHEVVMAQLL
jgi:hypothetical protein